MKENMKADILDDYAEDNDMLDAEDEQNFKKLDKKVDVSKNRVFKIMEKYNDGKVLYNSAVTRIKELLNLGEKEKVSVKLLHGMKPENVDEMEYNELVEKCIKGESLMDKAKEEMIDSLNMFIYYVIERKFSTFKKYTSDLYQEGVIGILKGIDQYRPEKGKPTTYFFIYIVHEMTEFINLNVNKTTSHYSANIVKVKRAISRFEREGRIPTIKDIAQETGISAETIAQAINIMESSKEVHYETVDYLDTQISQRNTSPEEEYLKNETAKLLQEAIDTLPVDEGNVIRLKYGLSGEEPMSYKNISIRLGIQIDKVKKLNSAGIRKLRKCKIISGNFKNLQKEEKALNDTLLGIVPIDIGEKLMDDLDKLFSEDEEAQM